MPENLPDSLLLAVVGAHLSGMPLNRQLTDLGAVLAEETTTAAAYRLYDLGTAPPKPGLIRDPGGTAIVVEVWRLGLEEFARFVDGLASPMAIGHLELADGRWVNGFVVEPYAVASAIDITSYGGWRPYQMAVS